MSWEIIGGKSNVLGPDFSVPRQVDLSAISGRTLVVLSVNDCLSVLAKTDETSHSHPFRSAVHLNQAGSI